MHTYIFMKRVAESRNVILHSNRGYVNSERIAINSLVQNYYASCNEEEVGLVDSL